MGNGNNTAAIAILNNPPELIQWGTKNHIQGLLDSYDSSYVFDAIPNWFTGHDRQNSEFVSNVTYALEKYQAVDIFVLSHTNDYYALLEEIPEKLRKKIRLVYNSGCYNARDAEKWLSRGAKVYVGHPGSSCSPTFFQSFKHYWWSGVSVGQAVQQANADMEKSIREGYRRDLTSSLLAFYCDNMLYWGARGMEDEKVKATTAQVAGNLSITIYTGGRNTSPSP